MGLALFMDKIELPVGLNYRDLIAIFLLIWRNHV